MFSLDMQCNASNIILGCKRLLVTVGDRNTVSGMMLSNVSSVILKRK